MPPKPWCLCKIPRRHWTLSFHQCVLAMPWRFCERSFLLHFIPSNPIHSLKVSLIRDKNPTEIPKPSTSSGWNWKSLNTVFCHRIPSLKPFFRMQSTLSDDESPDSWTSTCCIWKSGKPKQFWRSFVEGLLARSYNRTIWYPLLFLIRA